MATAVRLACPPPAAPPANPPKRRRRTNPAPVPPPPVPAPEPAPRPCPDRLHRYASGGVALMAVLSAGLNGYANSLHATVGWAGWLMGLAIPAIILILAKVAGLLFKRGARPLALTTAGVGVGLLGLSVWHCAIAIALLTNSPLALAALMAVAIDGGFVCCELALLEEERK